MTGPIMTFGKNLAGLGLLKDRQSLITKLYPRGSGSTPSELCLDNPQYWPAGWELQYDHSDSTYSHFTLPHPYASYYGGWAGEDYGDGWPINSKYYIGRGNHNAYNLAYEEGSPSDGYSLGTPSDAVAVMFKMDGTWRINSVSLYLQRILSDTPTQWTTQPRFIVGLYSAIASTNQPNIVQYSGYHVPYLGPLSWCYGNLFSISTDGNWYWFPLQSDQHTWTGWVAIVIMPYPTSNTQWSVNDYLFVGGSPALTSTANCYAMQCRSGVTQKNWMMGNSGGTADPYAWQAAIKVNLITTDVTSQFLQGDNKEPGRWVKCAIADYDSTQPYYIHCRLNEYLTAWDAIKKYGLYEGTLKDDTCTTQAALLAVGTQYLQAMSQPSMTVSLSAADLYDLDPEANWGEELYTGAPVMVIDDVLDLELQCVVTKIGKTDLTQPHVIDTLNLNNVHLSAQKLLAQLAKTHQKVRNYQQGQTVETPYTTAGSVSSDSPAEMTFYIRDATTLTHSVRLTVDTPGMFQIYVDGNAVNGGQVFSGMNEIDITDAMQQAHNGQVTPGAHTVTVHSPS